MCKNKVIVKHISSDKSLALVKVEGDELLNYLQSRSEYYSDRMWTWRNHLRRFVDINKLTEDLDYFPLEYEVEHQ